MSDIPGGDYLPPPSPIDQRTGLRPEELKLLISLSETQRAVIVTELGGTWPVEPSEQAPALAEHRSLFGPGGDEQVQSSEALAYQPAVESTVNPFNDAPEAPVELTQSELPPLEERLAPEEKAAAIAIAGSPKVKASLFHHQKINNGYTDASLHTKEPLEPLAEELEWDFTRARRLTDQSFSNRGPQFDATQGRYEHWWRGREARGNVLLAKIPRDSGITYTLVIINPLSVDGRPGVNFTVTIPGTAELEPQVQAIDANPNILLETLKTWLEGDNYRFVVNEVGEVKISDIVDKTKVPELIPAEMVAALYPPKKDEPVEPIVSDGKRRFGRWGRG